MSNQRLYTNKAMAIGAVIDALQCDLDDLTDIYMLTQKRLVDEGVLIADYPLYVIGDNDDDDSKDAINEDSWATVVNFTGVLS